MSEELRKSITAKDKSSPSFTLCLFCFMDFAEKVRQSVNLTEKEENDLMAERVGINL